MSGHERVAYAEQASAQVRRIYDDAILHLTDVTAKRLARGIDEPGWAERKLVELVRARQEWRSITAPLAGLSTMTRQMVEHAYQLGVKVRTFGNTGAVQALADDLAGTMDAANARILRWQNDVYRQVVGRAVGQSVAGTMSIREAAQKAHVDLVARGVTGFIDRSGQTWKLDSYTQMAVRTGTMRAHLAGTVKRLRDGKFELVQVSELVGSCPRCDQWEGQVLSLLDGNPSYPSVADAQLGGLFHPNCRHSIHGWTPDAPPVVDRADTQIRASLDGLQVSFNRVRESKRRLTAARPYGMSDLMRREQQLAKARDHQLDMWRRAVKAAGG